MAKSKASSKSKLTLSEDLTAEEPKITDNNTGLYFECLLKDCVFLQAKDLNYKIDDILLKKMKEKVEGRCIKVGYVMPNSVKIKSRSLGIINNANFDGTTTYNITYTATICNPSIGQEINCYVGSVDKSQVVCYLETPMQSPLEIYLHKNHHVGNVEFVQLKEGDRIRVKIAGSKFEFKDIQIIAIGQFLETI